MRLVGKAQFASEIGISAPAVTKALKTGRLETADRGLIDADSSLAQELARKAAARRYAAASAGAPRPPPMEPPPSEPTPPPPPRQRAEPPPPPRKRAEPPPVKKARAAGAGRPRDDQTPDEEITEFARRERILKLETMKQNALSKQLKNGQLMGQLVLREDVLRGIVDPINTAFVRMMTDLSKSLAGRVVPTVKGGADEDEIEALLQVEFSSIVKGIKKQMQRALKAFPGEST